MLTNTVDIGTFRDAGRLRRTGADFAGMGDNGKQRGCPWSEARFGIMILLWYTSSVLTSITTKEILLQFPNPITVAMVQQAFAAFCGRCTVQLERRAVLLDWQLHLRAFAPVAIPMVIALITYRWALMSATVAFTSTIKTLGPMFTILFSRLMLQARE